MDFLRVSYRLEVDPTRAEERAEGIALEQTVEVPRAVVAREPRIEREILGRVESVERIEEGASLATIAYPLAATNSDPGQLLGVLYGNSSLQPDVQCLDFEAPAALCEALRGPRFGLEGFRVRTGGEERALTCSVVKPLGHTPEALADLLRQFARAGIDVVKEDQGLADNPFCPFEARVRACRAAVLEVADATGHRVLYAPNLIGTPSRVFEQLHIAESLGADAVMASPMLIGLPTFWELVQERASVPVMAHPCLGGALRFSRELLFGKLLRLYGADAVIFVSHGGRFGPSRESCARIAASLRDPWHGLRPSLPVPGGGLQLENAAEAVDFYGRDTMLLVGGSLQLEEGMLEKRSRELVEAVAEASERPSRRASGSGTRSPTSRRHRSGP